MNEKQKSLLSFFSELLLTWFTGLYLIGGLIARWQLGVDMLLPYESVAVVFVSGVCFAISGISFVKLVRGLYAKN